MTRLFAALVLTLALGILSRQRPIGWYAYDKSLGDVLYAVAAYLGFALVLRRQPLMFVAVLALLFCWAMETFKLTGIPARYGHYSILLRWTLGTTFAWHNIASYVLGVRIIAGIDGILLRSRRVRVRCQKQEKKIPRLAPSGFSVRYGKCSVESYAIRTHPLLAAANTTRSAKNFRAARFVLLALPGICLAKVFHRGETSL